LIADHSQSAPAHWRVLESAADLFQQGGRAGRTYVLEPECPS
jgi:hypothetical protein